jgi:Holliday junction DNA helicase RuvA
MISVSGVGASTGRMMLSSLSPNEIISAILNENVQIIQSIKGIGLKTSQRIILELKDKVLLLEGTEQEQLVLNTESTEAASALEVLGYSQKQTSKILSKIIAENPGINVETLIKKALNKL